MDFTPDHWHLTVSGCSHLLQHAYSAAQFEVNNWCAFTSDPAAGFIQTTLILLSSLRCYCLTASLCAEPLSPVHSLDHTRSQTWSCSLALSHTQTLVSTWCRLSPCLPSLALMQSPGSEGQEYSIFAHQHTIKLTADDIYYNSAHNLLSSPLLSKNVNIIIFKIIILPAVSYGCETLTHTLREEYGLRMSKSRMMRKMYGVFQWILG